MPTSRISGRVDAGRRELGARISNAHVPSAAREGDSAPSGTIPASILLTVTPPVPPPVSLSIGATRQVIATVYNAVGNVLVGMLPTGWSSSSESVATVDGNGLLRGVGAGTTTIRATLGPVTSNGLSVTVASAVVDQTPASILITPSTATIAAGRTQQMTAVVKNAAGNVIAGLSPSGWTSATPATATVSGTGLVTGIAAGGPINITATLLAVTSNACAVTVTASGAGVQSVVTVTQPTLLNTAVSQTPSAGTVRSVANGGDFQAAINAAVPGDVIELAANAVVTGNYTLPVLSGGINGGWVTVRGAGSRPSEGVRVTEANGVGMNYPAIRGVVNGLPTIYTHVATSHWRFIGVTIEVDPSVTAIGPMVEIGDGGVPDTQLSDLPDGIYFDRCIVRGHATLDCKRAFAFNGKSLAYFDCCVKEIHSAFDAQGSASWNGPGPFKISNNLIEASAENIGFGGSDPAIVGLNPDNIEITRNYIRKDPAWLHGPWLIKNLLEFKKGRKVLIEGNVCEGSWPNGQAGFAVVLWSVNQQTTDTTAETANVTIRKNVFINCAGGMSLNRDGSNGLSAYQAVAMNHIAISNNIFIGLDAYPYDGNGRFFEINNQIENLSIEHNTGFSPSNASFLWGGTLPLPNHVVKNNLTGGGQYQLTAAGVHGQPAITACGADFQGNVVVLAEGSVAGNSFPGNFTVLDLAGGASAAYDATVSPAALALNPGSGYHGYATDGTDPGADVAAVLAATSGVTSRW